MESSHDIDKGKLQKPNRQLPKHALATITLYEVSSFQGSNSLHVSISLQVQQNAPLEQKL